MRRLTGLVLPALLAAAMLLPATSAAAAPSAETAGFVLAAEPGGGGEPAGLDPMDPNNTENPAAPADYEPPFLWAASIGLLALAVLGVLVLVGLYYVMVHRPAQRSASRP